MKLAKTLPNCDIMIIISGIFIFEKTDELLFKAPIEPEMPSLKNIQKVIPDIINIG